jgi:hypothetical protein
MPAYIDLRDESDYAGYSLPSRDSSQTPHTLDLSALLFLASHAAQILGAVRVPPSPVIGHLLGWTPILYWHAVPQKSARRSSIRPHWPHAKW